MKRQNIFIFLFVNLLSFDSNAQTKNDFLESVFHPDSLKSIVEVLASDSLKGRLSGSEGCKLAAQYITKEFEKAGLKPLAGNDGYFMPVTPAWGNVVGAIQGKSKSDEVIIFSAHYDHIGTLKTNPYQKIVGKAAIRMGDTIYNGANHNASGVSAIITLARYFANQTDNERTLIFAAFAGEELGLLGSDYFVSFIEPDLVKAVINIEMIGSKYSKTDYPFITGSEYSNLYEILNKQLSKDETKNYQNNYFRRDNFFNAFFFMRSDNYPFALLGIPAHTIMKTSPKDQYFHSVSDEVSTLDYKSMSSIIKAIAISCRGLVDGTDTPSRIKSLK